MTSRQKGNTSLNKSTVFGCRRESVENKFIKTSKIFRIVKIIKYRTQCGVYKQYARERGTNAVQKAYGRVADSERRLRRGALRSSAVQKENESTAANDTVAVETRVAAGERGGGKFDYKTQRT